MGPSCSGVPGHFLCWGTKKRLYRALVGAVCAKSDQNRPLGALQGDLLLRQGIVVKGALVQMPRNAQGFAVCAAIAEMLGEMECGQSTMRHNTGRKPRR